MKKTIKKTTPNFFSEHKELLIVGGTIITLVGAGFTWYYLRKKQQQAPSQQLIANSGLSPLDSNRKEQVAKVVANSNTPLGVIKYGSRNEDVKILQRYLKIYKEDLGTSGRYKDGVDGIFGPKTARAAKKRLGKAVFTKEDIEGMRKALKSMGK